MFPKTSHGSAEGILVAFHPLRWIVADSYDKNSTVPVAKPFRRAIRTEVIEFEESQPESYGPKYL